MNNIFLILFCVICFIWGIFLTHCAAFLLKEHAYPPKLSLSLYLLNGCSATLIFTWLFIFFPIKFFIAYGIFFSALLITIATDFHAMLISRFVTLYPTPLVFLLSWLHFLPLNIYESIFGAFSAYIFLRCIDMIYFKITKKRGMGLGDAELLAFIGSFLGPFGWWFSLIIGSCLGSCVGLLYMLWHRLHWQTTRLPFGSFLAYGSMIFLIFEQHIYTLLLKIFIDIESIHH